MKRILSGFLVLAAGFGLFVSPADAAITFTIDPTGTPGPAGDIAASGLDWEVNNALSDLGITAVNTWLATGGAVKLPFTTYAHAKLGTGAGIGSLPAGSEITYVAAFQERVANVFVAGGIVVVTFETATPAGSFFEVYHDTSPDADPLSGTGYNDGTLIMSGNITNVDGSTNFVESTQFAGNLDQSSGDDYPGLDTVGGGGHAEVTGPILFFDPNFFTFPTGPGLFLFSTISADLNLPFVAVDPSANWAKLPGGVLPTPDGAGLGIASLGPINGRIALLGGTGFDFQFQQDGTSTFTQVVVPEPTSIALWTMGLAMAIGVRMRRRK